MVLDSPCTAAHRGIARAFFVLLDWDAPASVVGHAARSAFPSDAHPPRTPRLPRKHRARAGPSPRRGSCCGGALCSEHALRKGIAFLLLMMMMN